MPRQKKTAAPPSNAASYRHPEADLPARPEIGAQAHFKKVRAPAAYRTVSAPFAAGDHRQVAVKVIDPRGNELLVVRKLEETR